MNTVFLLITDLNLYENMNIINSLFIRVSDYYTSRYCVSCCKNILPETKDDCRTTVVLKRLVASSTNRICTHTLARIKYLDNAIKLYCVVIRLQVYYRVCIVANPGRIGGLRRMSWLKGHGAKRVATKAADCDRRQTEIRPLLII